MLAIAGARLGFEPVLAVDVYPVAVETTRANAEANAVTVEAAVVDALADTLPYADLAVANVLLHPVEAILGTLATVADLDEIRVCLPGPSGALPALLDAGFRLEDHDHHMASRAGIIDPARCCPHPGLG